jgi:tetratricopeptide (TPR) repeat protein
MVRQYLGVILVVTAALGSASSTAAAEQKSWKGERVLPTKPDKDIKIADRLDGEQVTYRFSGRMPVEVRDDRGGWLLIHDGRREGWVKKQDFVPVRDAPAYFQRRVQASSKDTWALYMRGASWLEQGQPDKALKDFDECIRLDPMYAVAFAGRGNVWMARGDHDKAIKDYDASIRLDHKNAAVFYNRGIARFDRQEYDKAIEDYEEAISLDPKYALAFYNRGNAWTAKKDYDKAIKDYDAAIRLDPKEALFFRNRGVAQYYKQDYDKAIKDFDLVIRLNPTETYTVILGHFAARRAANGAAATRFLKESARNLRNAWPYAVVQLLRGAIDEPQLLKLADDNDKQTEARCYLGLDHAIKGRRDEALAHLRWVKEHGNQRFMEYALAAAELERLEKAEGGKR